jgi:hypothetical protein
MRGGRKSAVARGRATRENDKVIRNEARVVHNSNSRLTTLSFCVVCLFFPAYQDFFRLRSEPHLPIVRASERERESFVASQLPHGVELVI